MNILATMRSEADGRLEGIIADLERSLGKGAIMLPDSSPQAIEVIPTGIFTIDQATGVGGIPRGRITEVYGVESSGKSSLALHIISEAQKMGLSAAYIDAEHALDTAYAQAIGVRVQELLVSQPDNGEQGLEITEALVRTGEIGCIVIDSVAALVPSAEIEGSMDQQFVGLQARLMSKGLRKLTAAVSRSNCALIFLNQIREKVGGYGNPETTPGGRALKFYASLRLELRKGETLNVGQTYTGIRTKIKVVKNKCAPPYRTTEASCYFGRGYSRSESLADAAIESGHVSRSGAWLAYGGSKWQGKTALLAQLENDPELWSELVGQFQAGSH